MYEFSLINNDNENKQQSISIVRFLFIFIMLDFLSAYLFATLVVMSMEVLSGVTVYRSTQELHPPSTNSDATFDNFNPPPFHVLVRRKRNPWIKTEWSYSATSPFPFLEHEDIPR